jgi:competence protein ComEA
MARQRDLYIRGPLGKFLAWRYTTQLLLSVIGLLLISIGAQALQRSGNWPPAFMRPHPTVAITGPGINQQIESYVLGAVLRPGVYRLPRTARVRDLVLTAGGLLDDADITRVDMAALLADGESVYVPRIGEQVPLELGGKLNLNTASANDLHNALGVSASVARKIIAYRAAHGSFTAVSQLLLVPVSQATYDRIKDLVTV